MLGQVWAALGRGTSGPLCSPQVIAVWPIAESCETVILVTQIVAGCPYQAPTGTMCPQGTGAPSIRLP